MEEETNLTANDELIRQAQSGREAWRRLGLRLRGITPVGWLRILLVIAGVLILALIIRVAWLGLLPFIIGGVVAYIFLPFVNWLDRFLPRWFASLVVMSAALGFLIFFISQFIPFAARQVTFLSAAAPSEAEIGVILEDANVFVGELPTPIAIAVDSWLEEIPERIQTGLNEYAANSFDVLLRIVVRLFNAVGFILGFLVVPTWLLTVLNEQKKGRDAFNRVLPESVQPDFWAIVRIIDRVFSTFVRGQMLIALLVGILSYLGLLVVEWILQIDAQYLPVLAMFSGIMAFVPTLGPYLGSLPVILLGMVAVSPITGLYLFIMYVVVWQLIGTFVASSVEKRIVDVHPALLIVIIVMVSELGLIWVLLAAPITAVIRDLFRYVFGRLSEPPRPAGVLPGEPLPEMASIQVPAVQPRVPLVYQHGRNPRRTRRVT